jgi:DNA-binding transcriptional ArsR family regulator
MSKKCKAKKYAPKSNSVTIDCEREQQYGRLCRVHARLVASTPDGFPMNRIKRMHFENVTELELRSAAIQYCTDKGIPSPQRPNNPLSFRRQVLQFVEEEEEVTAGQIVNHIQTLTNSTSLNSRQVGQLMATLRKEGLVERKVVTVRLDGRKFGSAIYTLVKV